VIYLGSLSKTLALGLRLGFIVAHGFHESHVRNLIARYRERAA